MLDLRARSLEKTLRGRRQGLQLLRDGDGETE